MTTDLNEGFIDALVAVYVFLTKDHQWQSGPIESFNPGWAEQSG
jgi:hypothetical protein